MLFKNICYIVFWGGPRGPLTCLRCGALGPIRPGGIQAGRVFQKMSFLAYLIASGVPGPSKSNSASKNIPRDLTTASDRRVFIDWTIFCL